MGGYSIDTFVNKIRNLRSCYHIVSVLVSVTWVKNTKTKQDASFMSMIKHGKL